MVFSGRRGLSAGVLLLAVGLVAGCGGDPPSQASSAAGPLSVTPSVSPAPRGTISVDTCVVPAGGRKVVVPTADGLRLTGIAFGSGARGVALFHESGGTLCNWADYAWRLARRGLLVLAIDARNHGSSPATPAGKVSRYELDGVAAVTWLRAQGAKRIGLVGASVGGTLALVTAQNPALKVTAVASLSGPANDNQRLNALAGLERLPPAVLLIVGERDAEFSLDAEKIVAELPSVRLVAPPELSVHGTELLNEVFEGIVIGDTLTDFLVDALR